MKPHIFRLAVGAILILAGCASAPWSDLDGRLYHRVYLNRYPVRIVAVDGDYYVRNPVTLIKPGLHSIVVAAPPVAGFRVDVEKVYPFTTKPCERYYLAADRRSPLLQDWTLVVDYVEQIAGCDPNAGTISIGPRAGPVS
ncbi:MAG: hypothetical protein ABJB49_05695 [Nitrospirota bacterium]